MSFSITHITPSRIDILYDGEDYSVHGEAHDKSIGGLDYVINAGDFHYSDDAREFEPIPAAVRLAVIEHLKAELQRRDWAFEVDGEDTLRAQVAAQAATQSVTAGLPCPQAGYWFTPARAGSRRHFKVGEPMPDVGGAYGATIWQWDVSQ